MTSPHPSPDVAWCPGCGNFAILDVFNEAVEEAGIDRKNLVLVSGIGQAAKLPHYTVANVFNGLHGRALPAAAGIKLVNHKLTVVITSGDGDMYGEGGNHLLHNMRRNVSVKAFVHNNQVYGLTKGQASPTSDEGFVTKIQTHGVILRPFNPIAAAIVEDVSFVARSWAGAHDHLKEMMIAALRNQSGFTLLDILQPCVSFNRVNTFQWYRQRVKPVGDSHDPYDRDAALKLAFKWGDEIPTGIIYRSKRPSYQEQAAVLQESTMLEQFERAAAQASG